jgi:hypothetical protein
MEGVMKLHLAAVCALFLGFLCAEPLAEDQDVYVAPGKNGPVFSDQPRPGFKELNLRPLTVIPAQKSIPANKAESSSGGAEARQDRRQASETTAPYRSLAIVKPVDGSSVSGDTSFLEVRLAVEPPLLLSEGHSFVVSIDGHPVEQRFTAAEFMITPGFWPEGYLPAYRDVQLDVLVIDGNGQVVMRASPVRFRSLPVVIHPQAYPVYPAYPWGHPQSPQGLRPAGPPKKPARPAPRNDASKSTKYRL